MKHCKKNKDSLIDNYYQIIKDNSYYIIEEIENQIGGILTKYSYVEKES